MGLFGSSRKPRGRRRRIEDEALAVLTDQDSGRQYCVDFIDSFEIGGREYSVMYNYRPDQARAGGPEIIVMRAYRAADGTRYFTSIRNKKELEIAFEFFYERFRRASGRPVRT